MDANLAFLAAIVESSDDAIIGITPDGRIASWNSGARRIYGYNAGEVVGRPFSALALPERKDEIALLQKRLLRGERIKHFQTLHLAKSGQMLSISLTVSPILDNLGNLLGASAIARDITDRLHAEEALRQAEEKYRLIFAAETDAILLFDADSGHLADFNEAAMKLYGYGYDEFARLTLSDLCPDCRPGEGDSGLAPHGTISRMPLALHRRVDGSTFTAEMSISTFVWQGHSMLVGIVRDITEGIRNRELMQSLAVAKEIQQHLLPRQAPQVPGFDIHVRSLSCEEIGGDYYDFFILPGVQGPCFGIALGDVSGHGIGSALLMAMAKGLLHSEVHNCGADFARIFAGMNRHLIAAAAEGSAFMTLFFGLFDPASHTFHWCSAGHGPVFWYQVSQGCLHELPPTAMPLGISITESYEAALPVTLDVGDLLLLGTDGIWEARNPLGEMFETYRLRQLIATLAPKSAKQIHDSIMARVHDFMSGERPIDDMTLMVIKIVA